MIVDNNKNKLKISTMRNFSSEFVANSPIISPSRNIRTFVPDGVILVKYKTTHPSHEPACFKSESIWLYRKVGLL